MSSTSALIFIATSSSAGTRPPSTRYCQPAASSRLPSTLRKAPSRSMTATLSVPVEELMGVRPADESEPA